MVDTTSSSSLSGKSKELQDRLTKRMYRSGRGGELRARDLLPRSDPHRGADPGGATSSLGGREDLDVWGCTKRRATSPCSSSSSAAATSSTAASCSGRRCRTYERGYFLAEVLQRYYQDNLFIPGEILIPFAVDEPELLAEWPDGRNGSGRSRCASRSAAGESTASSWRTRNARLSHESRFSKSQQDRLQIAAQRLGQVLGFDRGDVEDRIVRHLEHPGLRLRGRDGGPRPRGNSDKNQYPRLQHQDGHRRG